MIIAPAGTFRALMLAVLLCSCSGSTGPASGVLKVQLGSLQGDEGAVLFTIAGGPVESVQAVSGTVHSMQLDANTLRVVVTGDLSSGEMAHVRIADVSLASNYSATVNQVAARSTYTLHDPAGYSISLAP
jgi:hypothetical protein